MNDYEFRDLTRKAMIREFLHLRQSTINIIDAANEIQGFLENHFELPEELRDLYEKFDRAVEKAKI